ncbi:MAG: hypothetical protein JKY65_01230 [Planctomycetes bacterium]|nr:hypothetical protein [Planctomycetota bacterium]
MGGLSSLVEFLSLNSLSTLAPVTLAPVTLAAGSVVVFGAWRSWTPRVLGLPALEPSLPPVLNSERSLESAGQVSGGQVGGAEVRDGDLLGLSVPGGGE